MSTLSYILAKNFLYHAGYFLGYAFSFAWPFLVGALIVWFAYWLYAKRKNSKRID